MSGRFWGCGLGSGATLRVRNNFLVAIRGVRRGIPFRQDFFSVLDTINITTDPT